jgi:hypothetical protein
MVSSINGVGETGYPQAYPHFNETFHTKLTQTGSKT